MDAYMYRAALLCEECGRKVREELTAAGKAPDDVDDMCSYDSDHFPKGPFADGGGEADCPQHCDACGVFLENPLTSNGVEYVEEACKESLKRHGDSVALDVWAPFYEISLEPDDEDEDGPQPGDECPNCKNGTLDENRCCAGECGVDWRFHNRSGDD